MTYSPYLIANYATGVDKRLQPWLIPDDAQEQLLDGYVYRGVMSKRPGYNYFATGERGAHPYTESRLVGEINLEPVETSGGVIVTGNGTAGPYTFRLKNLPLRRGDVLLTAGAQTALDDGQGAFVTTPAGGSGTVNYTTGDVSITFNAAVAGGTQIYASYDWFPGLPILGIMNFITSSNVKESIVADGKRLNKYNTTTNVYEFLGHTDSINAITNANPGAITTTAAHNLSTGDKIFIYGVLGMPQVNNVEYTITVTGATTFTIGVDTSAFGAYTSGGTVELLWQGNTVAPASSFYSWVNYPDKDNNPRLIFTNNVGQIGYYAPAKTPSVGNYVSYPTVAAPDFQMKDDAGNPITTITAKGLKVNKDRLIMLRTTENGNVRPVRIRISGTGANSDNFLITATGAGFIDIPDPTWINGSDFNRDDELIFTEQVWTLKYSGNDTNPFGLQKIDESRGSGAYFSVITYLNRTSAASPRGLIISDGYRVERQDELIPDFSFNEIDGANFELCFAGSVDEDRDHYLIYPTPDQSESKRILTTNYDEDNYSIYRLPLSCMGNYVTAFDITWNDLVKYPNWAAFAADYSNWNSFAYTSGAPFSLGGGHKGEIWRLNVTESEDNPVKIRNITIIDSTTVEVTTDWNNYGLNAYDLSLGADYIFITGVLGMVEINDDQYPIVSVTNNNVFRINVPSTANYSAYTSGGVAVRVIPFVSLMKKFNPFVNADKKVRCGWLYMYVDSTGTSIKRKIEMNGATQSNPCVISTESAHNLRTGEQIQIVGVSGMTQLNDNSYNVTVISPTTFSLDGIDSSAYTAYSSGGVVKAPEYAKINIDIITNDNDQNTQLNYPTPNPYQGTCTNLVLETGSKKWYKVYINQVGRFIQFRLRNQQAGANINIHATMPGFQPVGRLI